MSSDDKEQVMLESLQSGAVLYVVKPLKPDDLKNIWQHAVAAKRGQTAVVIEETESINQMGESSPSTEELRSLKPNNGGEINSAASMTGDRNDRSAENKSNNKDSNGKEKGRRGREEKCEEEDTPVATKKAKVVWTNGLHNRFLQAINHIGLEKAVPKRILEYMGVPGLTRENVASHLQKYRLFLKRVAEKGANYSTRAFSERSIRSNFPTSPSLEFRDFQSAYPPFSPSQQPFHPGIRGSTTAIPNRVSSRFPLQEPPRASSVPAQYPNGPPRFPGISSGFLQSSFGSSNPKNHQADRPGRGFQPNIRGTNPFPQRNMHYGPLNGAHNGMMNSARPVQAHQQGQMRAASSRFGAGIGRNGYVSGFVNLGALNNNGHAGMPFRMDQTQVNNPSSYGFMNGNLNNDNGTVGNYPVSGGTGFGSTGNGNQTFNVNGNQMQQTFNGFDRGNTSIPPFQQFCPWNGTAQNYSSNAISDQNQQQMGGIGGTLSNSNNVLQQSVASGVQNVTIGNSEVNPSMNQLINTSIPGSYTVQQNNPAQLQGGEQVQNTGFIGKGDSQSDYHPIFEQESLEGLLSDSELLDIFPVDNDPPAESWRNEFVGTLFDGGFEI